jgi:Outer membrane protein beta-barrel domain
MENTMKNTVRALALAASLAGALCTSAAAQVAPASRSNTAGPHLGVFLNGSAVRVEDSDVVESGAGLGVHLGYGFGQNLSVFARVDAASIQPEGAGDNYGLAHADLGVRYSFGAPSAAFRPFLQGAVSGRAVSFDMGSEGTLDARGAGISAGGGLEYFVSRSVAIEAGLSVSFGELTEGRVGGSDWVNLDNDAINITTSRFDIGLSWHP